MQLNSRHRCTQIMGDLHQSRNDTFALSSGNQGGKIIVLLRNSCVYVRNLKYNFRETFLPFSVFHLSKIV